MCDGGGAGGPSHARQARSPRRPSWLHRALGDRGRHAQIGAADLRMGGIEPQTVARLRGGFPTSGCPAAPPPLPLVFNYSKEALPPPPPRTVQRRRPSTLSLTFLYSPLLFYQPKALKYVFEECQREETAPFHSTFPSDV